MISYKIQLNLQQNRIYLISLNQRQKCIVSFVNKIISIYFDPKSFISQHLTYNSYLIDPLDPINQRTNNTLEGKWLPLASLIQYHKPPLSWVVKQLSREEEYLNIETKKNLEKPPENKSVKEQNKILDSIYIQALKFDVREKKLVLKMDEYKNFNDFISQISYNEDGLDDKQFEEKNQTDIENQHTEQQY